MNMKTGLILSILLVISVVKAETHWNTWMEDNLNFIGNYTLNEIMIPGTHDSGILFSKSIVRILIPSFS